MILRWERKPGRTARRGSARTDPPLNHQIKNHFELIELIEMNEITYCVLLWTLGLVGDGGVLIIVALRPQIRTIRVNLQLKWPD